MCLQAGISGSAGRRADEDMSWDGVQVRNNWHSSRNDLSGFCHSRVCRINSCLYVLLRVYLFFDFAGTARWP